VTYSFDEIRAAVLLMQADQGPLLTKMREILVRYEGDWILPLPDVENEPRLPQLTPALVGEAIDQIALRASSVQPSVSSPPLDAYKDRGVRSREYGGIRGQIISATLERSRWGLGRRRYYRHLTAYHTASLVVIPDMKMGMPRIEVRDPLCSFVEPQANESLRDPNYAAFVNRFSGTHLRARYPKVREEFGGPITKTNTNSMWEVVEWYDHEDVVWGLLGPTEANGQHISRGNGYPTIGQSMEIDRLPNRAECPPVAVPHNVSLGRIASRIGSLLGSIDLQAKLMALHIIAQEKAIFPDVYVIGRSSQEPQLITGDWKDGRTGEINMVQDAESIGVLRTTPDPTTGQMIDRLERNFRTSTSLVPQLGGETYGAMRTGRAIDALSGMALDPRVQELHEITEAYLPTLNSAILATYKGYWPAKKFSMYCGYRNRKLIEFTPKDHIETLENSVSYYIAGADVMQLTQILGSLFGAEAIAKKTFQEQHPMIGNSDDEIAQIREEKLEGAAIDGLVQQIMAGALPPTIAGMVVKEIRRGMDPFEAIAKIDEELRKLQATQAPAAPEGMVAPPESMPGLTAGPSADQQPVPDAVNVPPDAVHMKQLMAAMGA
jgi:hypothetical protein